jgi:hypothetical protein
MSKAARKGSRGSAINVTARCGVDLFWLPLGAGGHSVRLNGRCYEAVVAAIERRRRYDLYHSALEVCVPQGRFVIEMTPVTEGLGALRGVVAEGAVGSRRLRPLRIFRYEIRRWPDGAIPDSAEAVESPRRLSNDPDVAQRLLDLVPAVPTPTWGRDELGLGEMWNSNSLISWLLVSAGLDVGEVRLPAGGRAPGWQAGIDEAGRNRNGNGNDARTEGDRLRRVRRDRLQEAAAAADPELGRHRGRGDRVASG